MFYLLGILANRVDLTYRASELEWDKHRGLKILRPDPSLSGVYTCIVSTFEDEDRRSAPMIVWGKFMNRRTIFFLIITRTYKSF